MANVRSLKTELEAALVLLRQKGFDRAANRLEQTSQKILHPELVKAKKPQSRNVIFRGGSGRGYPGKLVIDEKRVIEGENR